MADVKMREAITSPRATTASAAHAAQPTSCLRCLFMPRRRRATGALSGRAVSGGIAAEVADTPTMPPTERQALAPDGNASGVNLSTVFWPETARNVVTRLTRRSLMRSPGCRDRPI